MTFDINREIFSPDTGEYDEEAAEEYLEALEEQFRQSPEGQGLAEQGIEAGWVSPFLSYGLRHLGVTPVEMTASNVDELLFEIFPAKVMVQPESAAEIVAELRAFWGFLDREYSLPNAATILKRLDERATTRLRKALGTPGNYGMAKSMLMQGQARGFDMTTQEGIEEWMAVHNSELGAPPPLYVERPSLSASTQRSSNQAAKRKARRKMEKASRKQNRRKDGSYRSDHGRWTMNLHLARRCLDLDARHIHTYRPSSIVHRQLRTSTPLCSLPGCAARSAKTAGASHKLNSVATSG